MPAWLCHRSRHAMTCLCLQQMDEVYARHARPETVSCTISDALRVHCCSLPTLRKLKFVLLNVLLNSTVLDPILHPTADDVPSNSTPKEVHAQRPTPQRS